MDRRQAKIYELTRRLEALWLANPQMRLGQLIENVYPCDHDMDAKFGGVCIYHYSDTKLIEGLEEAYHGR